MRPMKFPSVLVVLAGLGVLALVAAPSVHGQRAEGRDDGARRLTMLVGGGARIGVSIRDVKPTAGQAKAAEGVAVEDVDPDSPAARAGVKAGDVIVQFDGERVRSARQFTRLVEETPPGRTVGATIVRDGQRKDVQITPVEGPSAFRLDGDRLRERLGDLGDLAGRLPPMNFDFDMRLPEVMSSRARLGITTVELDDQLAEYFGVKDGGVLVGSVEHDSPAGRAGLKAGDVITNVNGKPVRSRSDLMRELRDARDSDKTTLGVVRDRKAADVVVSR